MLVRAVRYTTNGEIELTKIEIGEPEYGQVQVEQAACGICMYDIATCRIGSNWAYAGLPGHEAVGRVVKVGPNVTSLSVGDRVATGYGVPGGGFAKVTNVLATQAYRIPEDSDLEDKYWIVEPVACVVNGVDMCRLKAGERVVVIGSGFMGLLFLQILSRMSADQLIAVDIREARLKIAMNMGASEVYNSAEVDADQLVKRLKPRDIDVVVDTSGSQQGLDLASGIVRRGGVLNLFGWIKDARASFDPALWHMNAVIVINSSPGTRIRELFPPAIRLIQARIVELRSLITHVVTLDEYPLLMKDILRGNAEYIKGVVLL